MSEPYKVNLGNPKECKIIYGTRSGNSISEEHIDYEYTDQYAVKVQIPTVSSHIANVTINFQYNNVWGGHISVHRIAILDKNGGVLASYNEEDQLSGPVTLFAEATAAATVEVHIAIGVNFHLGSTITLNEVSYTVFSPDECSNPGDSCPPLTCTGEVPVGNPIGIRHGEKREEIKDISLNSPAGELALIRSYSQNKQSEFQFMGLGWNHNHLIKLTKITGTPNTIIVRLPTGGEAHFAETTPTNHYDGDPGVGSFVDWNPGTSQYTLTATDKSLYLFDSSGNLISRSWPGGEVWNYVYSGGKLAEVNDGYGRKLVFRYYTSGSFNGQLYRVGDHTFNDANPSNPTGRYVEYAYTLSKALNTNSQIVNGTTALLTTVYDVRRKPWTYSYYGQNASETDIRQLNYLIERRSPTVDTTGDLNPDGTLVLENDVYTMKGTELAVNGGMELDSDWTAVNAPVTHARVSSPNPVDSGTYSRAVDATAAGKGIEGNAWNLQAGKLYVITAKIYPAVGVVKMQVTNETAFTRTTSGTGSWQLLRAVYLAPANATGRKLQFVASGGAAQFAVDTVSIIETAVNLVDTIVQNRGGGLLSTQYQFRPGDQNVTTETRAGKVTTYRFMNGVYAGPEDPAGNYPFQELNDQYRPINQQDANGNATHLSWSSDGRRLTQVVDALVHTTDFAYYPDETLQYTTDAEGRRTEYTYGVSNPRLPTEIKVFNQAGGTVLRWQKYTYDSKGRVLTETTLDPLDLNGTTIQQQVTRSYYPSSNVNGYGLLQTVTQVDTVNASNNISTTYTYDAAGRVTQVKQTTPFGDCCGTLTTYDDAGNVLSTTTVRDWTDLNNPAKNPVTTYVYDELGRRIKTITNVGTSSPQTSLTVYDALNRVIRTIANYVPNGSIPNPYTASRSAFTHGTNNDQNLITDTGYNARGMVSKQISVVPFQGNLVDNVTLYGYDDAGRLIKTIVSASQAGYNNDYINSSPDPTLGSYTPNGSADQDIVTTQEYDANGNLVKTVDPLGVVSYTVYDALNRPVKTIRAAKDSATISLNPGDAGYDVMNDPRSTSYTPDPSPDRDLIEETEYDAMGRVFQTTRLLDNRKLYDTAQTKQWVTTRMVYDSLGRQVKTIVNYAPQGTTDPVNWVWINQRWEDGANHAIDHGTDRDQNLITQTVYDNKGRVLYSRNPMGITTWVAYDGLGRQIKTIVNPVGSATDGSANDPRSSSYVPSSAVDKDLITLTAYDANGRVDTVTDPLGRVTKSVYDSTGRLYRTITNFVDQGENPSLWVWNSGWKKSNGTTAISQGTDSDVNNVTTTVYDNQGRVSQTIDNRNNVTLRLYDTLGRAVKTIVNYVPQGNPVNPATWMWNSTRWEEVNGTAIAVGSGNDQNQITTTTYDLGGRVINTRNPAGIETRYEYDLLGRRTKTTANYVNGVFNAGIPDEDLISATVYNKIGQMLSTTDVRGTQTAFTYDKAGRRLTVTQAVGTALATIAYTCYDKAGTLWRSIQNWVDDGTSPDAVDASGSWQFPTPNAVINADTNLITRFDYDLVGRRIKTFDPLGNENDTVYERDGQVDSLTSVKGWINPSGVETDVLTTYRYDAIRRRTRVIQNYVVQGSSDPRDWAWDTSTPPTPILRQSSTLGATAVNQGTNNDQNVMVIVAYDKGGRTLTQQDSRGYITIYTYDQLSRRKTLKNPLDKIWSTTYADQTDGTTQTTMSYPGITGVPGYQVQRNTDRLSRLKTIRYLNENAPQATPNVNFTYNKLGAVSNMLEYSGPGLTNTIRKTQYTYDDMRRLISVGFDNDGGGTIDDTVSYHYEAGGLRTQLTLPGSLNVTYTYDAKGQLVSLTDWDNQAATLEYDKVNRRTATVRQDGLRSDYQYDAAGRLKQVRHSHAPYVFGYHAYQTDRRGNRVLATECLHHPSTTNDTIIPYNDKGLVLQDSWSEVSGFKQSLVTTASLKFMFLGTKCTLTMGKGSDHGKYQVYVNGTLFQTYDGYGTGQADIVITPDVTDEGPHTLEIRNTNQKNASSSNYKVRFKQCLVLSTAYTLQSVEYGYDALSRLLEARYNPNMNTAAGDADLLRRHRYTYDLAGNRTQEIATSGTTTTTDYDYTTANQILRKRVNNGTWTNFTYDDNGNLTDDGTNSYTWDRANRLIVFGPNTLNARPTALYTYDGLGNRISKSIGATSPTVTQYLLDLQPGLPVILSETAYPDILGNPTFSNTTRYIHALHGIHAQKDPSGNWEYMLQDGLGSVRGAVAYSGNSTLETRQYTPYGEPFGVTGSSQTPFGFTGEPTDANGLSYLRARYYSPTLGVFTALDPLETANRYAYVGGNPTNRTDPSGMQECVWVYDVSTEQWICIQVQVPQQPQQPSPETDAEKHCKEHPDDPACDDWWDKNDPNGCLCNSNNHPSSSKPFRDGIWGSAEYDLMCNLSCYGGHKIVRLYQGLSALRGMQLKLMPNFEGDTKGAFLYAGQQVVSISEIEKFGFPRGNFPNVEILDDDVVNFHKSYNRSGGGYVVVRQAGGTSSRANRLATFVEEIAHAFLYYSPLCESLTPLRNEAIAKFAKVLWIRNCDLNAGLFAAQLASDARQLLLTPNDGRAFKTCPGQTSSAEVESLVSFISYNSLCIDPFVARYLVTRI